MSILHSILITLMLAGNLFATAYDSSESEEKELSCGRPVLRPCACVTRNPCEIEPSEIKHHLFTAEDVQKNIRTDLPKELDLSGQGIKALDKKNVSIQVCIEGDTVQRLDILETPANLTSGCKQVSTKWETYDLSKMGISKFEKGWYRLKDENQGSSHLSVINFRGNNIVQVTSNIMNELPEYITWMDLNENKIERLEEGCFEHEHIFSLSLTSNLIGEIEQNAFKMPELYQLYLNENRLKDTKFVSTLPSSLVSLDLKTNEITEISANSFSNLKKLSYLSLSNNKLTVLPNRCLLGATSINQLSFSNNEITTVASGAFEDLDPFQIFLDGNNISSIEKGTFTTITGLKQLNLERNQLTIIKPEMFDQPNLRLLQLAGNNIISIKKGALEKLTKLETLDISKNPIKRVDDHALIGLNKRTEILIG